MAERVVAGRYRLLDPLGRGGMAVVWRGRDDLLGRPVAVKTVDLTGPDSLAWGARFEREARATAALNHPNIVTVYDTGVEDDTAYLVMELLPGPTLAAQLHDEGPLPVERVRSIGLQMCAALTAAHRAGIIHRDIKPANVSYAADGTVKVLDFGITQLMDDHGGPSLTRTNTVMGTADYLAPEQASGGRVDERADLYALGCVLFALLTGEAPFTADTPVATMLRHAREDAPDVRDLRPGIPADLAATVDHLLAKRPEDRPASAEEVAALLRGTARPPAPRTSVLPGPTEALAAGPPAATPRTDPLPMAVPPRPVPPRKGVSSWLPWLLLVLLIGAAAIYLVNNRSKTPETPATTTSTSQSSSSTSAPQKTTTRPTTTSTTTSTTTTTTTTSSTTTTTDPAAALAALRTAVTTASGDGGIDAVAAKELNKKLDDIQKALGGKDTKAQAAVDDFGTTVQKLVSEKHITEAGSAALSGPFGKLQQAVAPQG